MKRKLPGFILTENLGRLAKWLRILGYDAAIYKSISFNNMKRIAVKDRRMILTRDKGHVRAAEKRIKILLIRSTDYLEQLAEMKEYLNFNDDQIFTRCPVCNKLLYEISGKKIKELIPEYIFEQHKELLNCRKCGRIFWKGTHYKEMLRKLSTIFTDQENRS